MGKKRHGKLNTGFTLVELIVVIAIIGILIAIAVPAYTGFREKTTGQVCLANRAVFARSYQYELAADGSYASKGDFSGAMEKAVEGSGLNRDKSCPGGGKFTFSYDSDGNVMIKCSVHGAKEFDNNIYSKASEAIFANEKVKKYLNRSGYKNDMHMDSTSTLSGSTVSQVIEEVKPELEKLGIDTAKNSWTLYQSKNKQTQYVYWTNQNISRPSIASGSSKTVEAYRYNLKTGQYETGTVKVTGFSYTQSGMTYQYNVMNICVDSTHQTTNTFVPSGS
jgi:prepilin-type N-terminal cleavage/methylation domain-containing protein